MKLGVINAPDLWRCGADLLFYNLPVAVDPLLP